MTSPRGTPNTHSAGTAVVDSAEGRALGGVTASIWTLQQGWSYMVAEVSELSPPLQHPCRDQEQEGTMGSGVGQISAGIPAHHLLSALLGQCPFSDPQFTSSVKWG